MLHISTKEEREAHRQLIADVCDTLRLKMTIGQPYTSRELAVLSDFRWPLIREAAWVLIDRGEVDLTADRKFVRIAR